jgi:hypothetical protein
MTSTITPEKPGMDCRPAPLHPGGDRTLSTTSASAGAFIYHVLTDNALLGSSGTHLRQLLFSPTNRFTIK